MQIEKVNPDLFKAKYGEDAVRSGSHDYFVMRNGMGVIKDNNLGLVEMINVPSSLTEKEEEDLLTSICGEFTETVDIPKFKDLVDYTDEEHKTNRLVKGLWIAQWSFLAIVLISFFLIFMR